MEGEGGINWKGKDVYKVAKEQKERSVEKQEAYSLATVPSTIIFKLNMIKEDSMKILPKNVLRDQHYENLIQELENDKEKLLDKYTADYGETAAAGLKGGSRRKKRRSRRRVSRKRHSRKRRSKRRVSRKLRSKRRVSRRRRSKKR